MMTTEAPVPKPRTRYNQDGLSPGSQYLLDQPAANSEQNDTALQNAFSNGTPDMEALSQLAMAAALGPSPKSPPVRTGSSEFLSQEELQDGARRGEAARPYRRPHLSITALRPRPPPSPASRHRRACECRSGTLTFSLRTVTQSELKA
ncbi:unnamed protein product [Arctogadus glacialis]